MHRFYALRLDESHAALSQEEASHALKVLRLRAGDECQALMEGEIYAAVLEKTEPEVILLLGEKLPSPEAQAKVTLYQGLPKGDKMEFITQKCTEGGVYAITPVLFSRCVVKWEKKDNEKKLPRWQRIAQEAGKQSGRAITPEIHAPLTLKELCGEIKKHELALVPWEEEKGNGIRKNWQGQKDVAIVIGPEGGMSEEEIALLKEAGAVPVTLGPRILRTETAGMAALFSLLTLSGDME